MHLLIRLFVITLSFFAGCVGSGLAYVFLAKLVIPDDFGRLGELELTVTLVVGVFGVSSLFARAVLLPAMAIITVYELLKMRGWLSHVLAGGGMALAIAGLPLVSDQPPSASAATEPAEMIAIRVACAIIGATVYWWLAGRNAGRWLPSDRQASDRQAGDLQTGDRRTSESSEDHSS